MVRGLLSDENAIDPTRGGRMRWGRHPQFANIAALFQLLAEAPAKDTHLVHVARMALRDQLRDDRS
jgi:hypothetical protein